MRPQTTSPNRHRKSSRSRWFEMVHGSVVHELVRKTGQISVHVISAVIAIRSAQSVQARPKIEPIRVEAYLGSAAAVAIVWVLVCS